MTSLVLPRIAVYHSAWTAFAQHQYDDLEQALKQSQTNFVAARRQLLFQLILACLITIFVTIRVIQEIARRLRAEEKLLQ